MGGGEGKYRKQLVTTLMTFELKCLKWEKNISFEKIKNELMKKKNRTPLINNVHLFQLK